ncbi:hypothetical protein T310_9916, partial [Rasamsonia emersonii CBS 393.64]
WPIMMTQKTQIPKKGQSQSQRLKNQQRNRRRKGLFKKVKEYSIICVRPWRRPDWSRGCFPHDLASSQLVKSHIEFLCLLCFLLLPSLSVLHLFDRLDISNTTSFAFIARS